MRQASFAILLALGIATPGFGQVIGVGGGTTGAGSSGGQTIGGGIGAGSGGTGQGGGFGGIGGAAGAADEFGDSLGTADEGFIGQNLNAQQGGFIGGNQAAAAGPGQGQRPGGQFGNTGGARGGAFGGRGQGQGQGQRQQPQQRNQVRNIRVKLTMAPDFAAAFRVVPPQQLQSRMARKYRRISSIQREANTDLGRSPAFRNANVSVTANGRSVTLRGQVASEREKSLAARIARLEPGVDQVVNELVVTP